MNLENIKKIAKEILAQSVSEHNNPVRKEIETKQKEIKSYNEKKFKSILKDLAGHMQSVEDTMKNVSDGEMGRDEAVKTIVDNLSQLQARLGQEIHILQQNLKKDEDVFEDLDSLYEKLKNP